MAITAVEVKRREPFCPGMAFGEGGTYERIDAVARFAVDPAHPANGRIADLGLAPRDASGRVTFEADFVLLQPTDPARANGNLLASVSNRGRTTIVPFSFPPAGWIPVAGSEAIEPGDAFLLRHGWTVGFGGWQWDVIRGPGRVGLEAPLAFEADGRPATTAVTCGFQPLTARASEYLGHWPTHPPFHTDRVHIAYPAADLDDQRAVMTVHDRPGAARTVVPRARWRFARVADDDSVTSDDSWVALDGGFTAGLIYEVTYGTSRCPVAGCGLLAFRDLGSFLRDGPEAMNPAAGRVRRTFAHGVSQSGRFLRDLLWNGLNLNESGRQVYDGIFVQVAGARRGEFNFRGAQPSAQYVAGPAQQPPFAYASSTESAETLADRQRAVGGMPKVFEFNTANEYWRSNAALVHADAVANRDHVIPDDVRVYMMASCQHGPGVPFLAERALLQPEQRFANPMSILNQTAPQRAALAALERWVTEGVEPPPSNVPALGDATLVPQKPVLGGFHAIPGVSVADAESLPRLAAAGGEPYASYVSAIDADGNEVAGVRLPDLTVPLATHAGWNVRHAENGGPGQIADMTGSSIPFAVTREERERAGDPRPSIAERYRDEDDYLGRYREAALASVAERWVLAEDVDRLVEGARRMYRRLTSAEGRVVRG